MDNFEISTVPYPDDVPDLGEWDGRMGNIDFDVIAKRSDDEKRRYKEKAGELLKDLPKKLEQMRQERTKNDY